MKFPNVPRSQRAPRNLDRHLLRSLAPTAAALLLPLAIGCASPGPPRPPSLHLPRVVTNLTAQRIGDNVELRWTTPAKTTDDLNITGTLTAEICRETLPTPGKPASPSTLPCVATKRLVVRPGPGQATDPLPSDLTTDPLALLAYRVQIFNDNGRSAGLSARAFTAAGAAPPPPIPRATPTMSGIQLEWPSTTPPYPIEFDRILVVQTPTAKPSPKSPSTKPPATKQPLDLAPPTPTEVHLRVENQPTDAGGTIDQTVQKGQTYQYTAQRVRKVTLDSHTIELRSLPSPPITVVMRDTFAPASPTGLAAIPGETNLSNRSASRSIDLSWEPNTEPDIAGYIVYRQEISGATPSGPPIRLTPEPVIGPAFSDKTALPGHHYAYSVTAVDTTGNESAPSAIVQETLTEQ